MAYYDLREFMEACDKAGEMVTIEKEVDWNLEVGAISRRICEIGAPMAHMTKIRGITNGASILGSPLARGWNSDFSRIAIGLGMDKNASYQELMDQFMKRMSAPIRPLQVSGGPCKENILRGDFPDFVRFPWFFDRLARPRIEANLAAFPVVSRIVRLRSRRETTSFLQSVPTCP